MKKRLWAILTLVLVVAAVAGGCGSGAAKKESPAQMPATGAMPAPPSAAPAPKPSGGSAGAPSESKAADAYQSGAAALPQNLDRKIIMNAEIDVKIKDANKSIDQISDAVRSAGGYVQETRQTGTRQQGRTVQMVLRVPAGSYGNILMLIAGMAEEVLNRREWTSDVTAEYLDLDARIKTKEIHLAQLQKLYDRGGTIKEMMELEQEIARVTADLESLKGRFRYISSQVDFSTVTVKLYEPGAPTPIKPPASVWERMKLGFQESWSGVVNFTGNLAVFLVSAIPVLVYVALMGGVGYLVYRGTRKFWRRPPAA